jgi:hypothetical protein
MCATRQPRSVSPSRLVLLIVRCPKFGISTAVNSFFMPPPLTQHAHMLFSAQHSHAPRHTRFGVATRVCTHSGLGCGFSVRPSRMGGLLGTAAKPIPTDGKPGDGLVEVPSAWCELDLTGTPPEGSRKPEGTLGDESMAVSAPPPTPHPRVTLSAPTTLSLSLARPLEPYKSTLSWHCLFTRIYLHATYKACSLPTHPPARPRYAPRLTMPRHAARPRTLIGRHSETSRGPRDRRAPLTS